MNHLMKLAEALRDIAEKCDDSEIEQALGLCTGFTDRVSGKLLDAFEFPEPLGPSIVATCSRRPN